MDSAGQETRCVHGLVALRACSDAGILLWSIAFIQEGRDVAAAFCFAVLLNMKHLFAALAPLYIVYLFRHYCRSVWIFGFTSTFGHAKFVL